MSYTVCAVVAVNVYLHVEVGVAHHIPGIVHLARGAGGPRSQHSKMVSLLCVVRHGITAESGRQTEKFTLLRF